MRIVITFLTAVMFNGAGFADNDTTRSTLIGVWQVENGLEENTKSLWVFEGKGDAIRITHSKNSQIVADVECKATGRDCEAIEDGRPAKASLYFNGSILVELVTRGSEVFKRRFLVQERDTMGIELISIVPDGKPQAIKLKRVKSNSAQ